MGVGLRSPYLNKTKLAKAIDDLGMFHPIGRHDWERTSYKIVGIILKAIKKGLQRDGFVTIEGLGRFYVYASKGKDFYFGRREDQLVVKFTPCIRLYRELDDEQES